MALDPEKLDQLIKDAGLGPRSAKKLREANQAPQPQASRGHGAPAPIVRTRGGL